MTYVVSGFSRIRQPVIFFMAVTSLLALAVVVQLARERAYSKTPIENRLLYISSGKVMEKVALSYDVLLADVYWVRALQHFGAERLRKQGEKRYDLLYPLLDLTTTLDPLFIASYRFGAIFLAEPHPGGAGRPDLAIELLKKGVNAMPAKWDYYHDIGFVYYWNLHEYKNAADWFRRGGELPGAPWWMTTYAAIMLTRGGDRQASRFMWQQLEQSADNDWLRQTAQLRLMQLDALDRIDLLKRAAEDFRSRTERLPESWQQLIGAGLLNGIPVDPTGTPYVLDYVTGEITLSGWSKLYPLPTEPAAAPELADRPPRPM